MYLINKNDLFKLFIRNVDDFLQRTLLDTIVYVAEINYK